ncbi:hypothetical protein [uncultured Aquimarina sp.]|uniref:hypothetical protein n=1 Tax=uncultured Aquimarina sp. TaxID=575652 RepID=UPI00261B28C7|nr:hypothetical protein [uncultured Aquimarina sp.]
MTRIKVFSLLIMALGVIVFFFGILFRIMHWPIQYYLLISGPILFVLGIGLLLKDNKVE